jgi:methionine-rich copper-binding protein CopC
MSRRSAVRATIGTAIGWLLLATLLAADPAAAHALLDHADPRANSTVRSAPAQVRLWFTQGVELAFSTVKILNAKGQQVDNRDLRTGSERGDLLLLSLPTLPPGTYRVIWRVLSVDSHITEGKFTFRIAPMP